VAGLAEVAGTVCPALGGIEIVLDARVKLLLLVRQLCATSALIGPPKHRHGQPRYGQIDD